MLSRPLARVAATAAAAAGIGLATAALVPGTAAATTYTCSNGHLYADGTHVPGDSVTEGNWTTGCSGNRVRTVIRVS